MESEELNNFFSEKFSLFIMMNKILKQLFCLSTMIFRDRRYTFFSSLIQA